MLLKQRADLQAQCGPCGPGTSEADGAGSPEPESGPAWATGRGLPQSTSRNRFWALTRGTVAAADNTALHAWTGATASHTRLGWRARDWVTEIALPPVCQTTTSDALHPYALAHDPSRPPGRNTCLQRHGRQTGLSACASAHHCISPGERRPATLLWALAMLLTPTAHSGDTPLHGRARPLVHPPVRGPSSCLVRGTHKPCCWERPCPLF